VEPLLHGRRRVIVSLDGELVHVPLEALPADGARHLIDDFNICHVVSGRNLLRPSHPADAERGEPVVIADPDFGPAESRPSSEPGGVSLWQRLRGWLGLAAPATETHHAASRPVGVHGTQWKRLRFSPAADTRAEGESVAALLRVTPWLGGEAQKDWLAEARAPRILHLATHGYFLGNARPLSQEKGETVGGKGLDSQPAAPWENPLLQAGVALAGANRGAAELLTARDVTALDLSGTDLTVLSACESNGEQPGHWCSVVALQQSLIQSGCRSVVMSLWHVPETVRQELLADFYTRLQRGTPAADALREARLQVKSRQADPRHWGAWICQG
jgi:CHAT domain-containing protein